MIHDHAGWGNGPPGESSVTFVGKQAREAYEAVAVRLFQKQASHALVLQIESVRASVELKSDGWHAIVEHELVIRDEAGGELGRWTVEGRGRIEGLGEGAVPGAFARAAALAARRFESRFETPPEVVQWLSRNGIAAGTVARREAAEEPPLQPPPAPRSLPRAPRFVGYLEAGPSANPLSASLRSGTPAAEVVPGLDARLGFAGGWAFAQIGFSRWGSRNGNEEHSFASIGLEAGPQVRIGGNVDLAVGAGVSASMGQFTEYSLGPQPVWVRSWRAVPNVVAAIRFALPFASSHVRLSLEARLRFISFDSVISSYSSYFGDHFETTTALGLLIGGELPLGGDSQ